MMKTYRIVVLFAAIILYTAAVAQEKNQAEPTRIRIGETIITLQSPLRMQPAPQRDSVESTVSIFIPKNERIKKYPRHSEELYLGFGFAVPTHEEDYLPIYSGSSFNLDIGYRYLYHPSKRYAIGTFLQYTCYSYRMKNASYLFMGYVPEGDIYREFYRTDNIGTGLIQRVRLFPRIWAEGIVYGDYAYSKRFKVKSHVDGDKEKTKYRDGTKFNAFGAGAQLGLKWSCATLYARYRFTNFFNHDEIPEEVPKLSIGMSFTL